MSDTGGSGEVAQEDVERRGSEKPLFQMMSRRGRPRKGDEKHAGKKEDAWENVTEANEEGILRRRSTQSFKGVM